MWVGGTPWSLRVCNIVFLSIVHVLSQFLIFYFSFLRSFLYQPAKIVCAEIALPSKQDFREVLLRPSYGLVPNKMGFLHLSCIFHALRSFFLKIAFTNLTASFLHCPWQSISVQKVLHEIHERQFMFSFAFYCTL